jgi:uncharacterized protein (DUF885 family)
MRQLVSGMISDLRSLAMIPRTLRAIFLVTLACLVACQQMPVRLGPDAPPVAARDLDGLMRDFIAGHYQRVPTAAVNSGLHEYDGRLPDFSPEGIRERVAWLVEMRRRTAAIDAAQLDVKERLYHGYLAVEIDTQLFNIQTLKVLENNAWYDYLALDPNVYLSRNYAPLAVRMDAYTRHVSELPATLVTMRRTLKPMPSGHAEGFRDYVAGLAGFVTTAPYDVFSAVDDPARQAAMKQTNDLAAAALTGLAHWVDTLPRDEDFALGAEKYAQMLWALERIDTPIGELKALAERDYGRNLQTLQRACAVFAPGATLRECRARVAVRKPPDGPIAAASRQVDQLRRLLLERHIASIPAGLQVIIAEAPPHQRSATAYIAVPGPLEKDAPSIYYISPPDPDWSVEDQKQYLQSEADLMATTTHCVWTGHILEAVRSNLSGNPLAVFTYSYAYTEGWSHYSEEMMLHEALDDDPEMAIGQLQNALMNDVRALSSIGLHTGGMSVRQAEQLFLDQAFSDPESARQEAVRGTFDPGYVLYLLGKLMVVKLRDDWLALHPGSSLGDFHEAFLSYGNPPPKLLRKVLLGGADDGRLF